MSHSGTQLPDDEFLECVRRMQLDPEAAKKVFDVLFPYLSAILLKVTRDVDLVPDLLQETYIALFTKKMSQAPKSVAQFRGYAAKIATNCAIDYLRRKRRRPEEHDTQIATSGVPSADDPLRQLAMEELRREFEGAVKQGVVTQQQLDDLMEVHVHDRSCADLASERGLHRNTVAKEQRKTKSRLAVWFRRWRSEP